MMYRLRDYVKYRLWDNLIYYISHNIDIIKKTIIISLIVSIIPLLFFLYQFLKKEDPQYTSYSCSKFFTFSENKLLNDTKINVLSKRSFEEGISPISLIFDSVTARNNVVNLFNETNKIIDKTGQLYSDSTSNSLNIPKGACYETLNTDYTEYISSIESSSNIFPSSNLTIYNWVKTYKDHWGRDFSSLNVVFVINKSATQIQIDLSNSVVGLFSGFKGKISAYELKE